MVKRPYKAPIVFTIPLMTASRKLDFTCHGQACWINPVLGG